MNTSSQKLIRIFDITLACIGLLVLSPVLLLILILGFFDSGSPLLRQERVGRYRRPFVLIKFRTMSLNTPHVPSHLASSSSITPIGAILRRTKLDELPQLWNVLKGDMSVVGPRPSLFSQVELIDARDLRGVYSVRPGITGLAQINMIDMSRPVLLAETDEKMIRKLNLFNYLKYIIMTLIGNGFGDRVHTGS